MSRMIRRAGATVACVVTAFVAHPAFSAELTLPSDGWASWQAPAVADAPDWCCWGDWSDPSGTRQACRLDRQRGWSGNRDGGTSDSVRVYARFADGKIDRLRVYSASCPVQADTEIQDLGVVGADDGARWLAALVKDAELDAVTRRLIDEDAMAALAIHDSAIAFDTLADIARDGARDKQRQRAVFWLAHLRGKDGAEVATSIMFGDRDADVRAHAAFAVARSKSPSAEADLIRLGNTDRDEKVRSQAWFWLAQSGAAGAEAAIDDALRKEANEAVRDHAIFALSRLPDERATPALIAVAENKSLASTNRKRAVFWLSRSESSAAQAYLDRVLAASSR